MLRPKTTKNFSVSRTLKGGPRFSQETAAQNKRRDRQASSSGGEVWQSEFYLEKILLRGGCFSSFFTVIALEKREKLIKYRGS
ncbi:MAG TPA: hypothetical protein DCW97_04110 [Acidobacteria bacterium]|nr:hypothetical protein [Acidobacteriota bacterium]